MSLRQVMGLHDVDGFHREESYREHGSDGIVVRKAARPREKSKGRRQMHPLLIPSLWVWQDQEDQ